MLLTLEILKNNEDGAFRHSVTYLNVTRPQFSIAPGAKSGKAIISNFGRGKGMLKKVSKCLNIFGPILSAYSACWMADSLAHTENKATIMYY